MQLPPLTDDQRFCHIQRSLLQVNAPGKRIRQARHEETPLTGLLQHSGTTERLCDTHHHTVADVQMYGVAILLQRGTQIQCTIRLRTDSVRQVVTKSSRQRQFTAIQYKCVCRIELTATIVGYLTVDPIYIRMSEETGNQISLREAIIIIRRVLAIRHDCPHSIRERDTVTASRDQRVGVGNVAILPG